MQNMQGLLLTWHCPEVNGNQMPVLFHVGFKSQHICQDQWSTQCCTTGCPPFLPRHQPHQLQMSPTRFCSETRSSSDHLQCHHILVVVQHTALISSCPATLPIREGCRFITQRKQAGPSGQQRRAPVTYIQHSPPAPDHSSSTADSYFKFRYHWHEVLIG